MKTFHVGIIGATGMVGQRFAILLENHPWFQVKVLAASGRSAGKTYKEAVGERWSMPVPMPKSMENMVVYNASEDVEKIAAEVDFVFCAVDMKKDEIKALEERYAKAECPVVSNNSAHRGTKDVPMIVPEINPEHAEIIKAQRKRLGTKRGFIAVKSNCSLQSYVPALHPLMEYGVKNVLACTYQAISGAGKTFERWPEMVDNVIPFIIIDGNAGNDIVLPRTRGLGQRDHPACFEDEGRHGWRKHFFRLQFIGGPADDPVAADPVIALKAAAHPAHDAVVVNDGDVVVDGLNDGKQIFRTR